MIVKCCEENVKNDVLEGQLSASKQQWLLRDPAFIVYNLSGENCQLIFSICWKQLPFSFVELQVENSVSH